MIKTRFQILVHVSNRAWEVVMFGRLNKRRLELFGIVFLVFAALLPHLAFTENKRAVHPFFNFKLFAAEYQKLTQIYSLKVLGCSPERKLIYPHDIFLEGNFTTGEKKYRYYRRFEALFPLLNDGRNELARSMILDIATHSQLNYHGCDLAIFRGVKQDETKRWTETEKVWTIIEETRFHYE